MAIRSKLAGAILASSVGLLGCQGYNVDPVKPFVIKPKDQPVTIQGRKLSPNIMFVIDRSGSMSQPIINNSDTDGCVTQDGNYNYDPHSTRDCKWKSLLSVMLGSHGDGIVDQLNAKLSTATDPVRIGLLTFAGDADDGSGNIQGCYPGSVRVPVAPAGSSGVVDTIKSTLNEHTSPGNATPTAKTMLKLAGDGVFPPDDARGARDNYAILMTDGAPNCDSDIHPTEALCSRDRCTSACPAWVSGCACFPETSQPYASESCLDEDALVNAIKTLHDDSKISTFVIGFGAGTLGGATQETLNRSAQAGGFPKPGSTSFYQATSQAELLKAFEDIVTSLTATCDYTLDGTPSDPALVQVEVTPPGGTQATLTASQYSVSGNKVTITDPTLCGQIVASTQDSPAKVEFKFLAQ